MASIWQKNEVTATKRRAFLRVMNMATGQLADRGIDFTGYVFLTRDGVKSVLGVGTIVNHRRDLVAADDTVESVDTGDDNVTLTAHGLETGDGPFVADEAMGAIGIGTQFWIIVDNDNEYGIAASLADAYAGTRVALAGTEAGAIISDVPGSTERGIDGEFWYTATQAETNYITTEIIVSVYGYADHEGQTTVGVSNVESDFGDVAIEAGYTRDDCLRVIFRTVAANYSVSGGAFIFRDISDTKNSHHGTITSSGRSDADIDDPTP